MSFVPADLLAWLGAPLRRPLVMGVLNVTPDSFSDGGRYCSAEAALARAEQMVAEGADWIDVGAESTRPGAQRVAAAEQLSRLAPVLAGLRRRVPAVLSIDTTLAPVAAAALDGGFDVLNDISAGRDDPAMFALAAGRGAPIILMHSQGEPSSMQRNPVYDDVTAEVSQFLRDRMTQAELAGVAREKILLDPGIGFGKTVEHNLRLLAQLPELAAIGQPVLIGVSRKSFIGAITGEGAESGRLFGAAAAVAWASANGAAVLRVHDVAAMAQVVRMAQAIKAAGTA